MMEERPLAGFEDVLADEGETPSKNPERMTPRSLPEVRSLLGVVVAVVVIAGLYFGRDVLIPMTLAVMLSFVLSPMVKALERLRLWRGLAVTLTMLIALGALTLLGTIIGNQAAGLSADLPKYARTIEQKVEGLQGFTTEKISAITRALGARRPPSPRARSRAAALSPETVTPAQPLPVHVVDNESSPLTIARSILQPVLGPLETLIIVIVVSIFVLMQKEDLRDRFIRVFGSADLHRTTLALDDAGRRLSRFFLSQLVVNTSFGVVISVGLWAIGIPAPAMWGILAGLLRFVPYVGSFLAAIVPMALGAAIDPGWSTVIYVALLFLVVEPLTGYVVEPLLYGRSTGLSPVSVIVAAVFWTWVWGPIGLILSTPLTLCLVVMGRHVKSLEFFDVLLGDRPALTNLESFYQRILANDPEEALAQAEHLLDHHSLAEYYDEVVLPSLRRAAEDRASGRLEEGRGRRMAHAIMQVITDLDDYAGPGEKPGVTVACIAGRRAFDPMLNAMAAQLLRHAGLATQTVAHEAVGRNEIGSLDLSKVSVIVLSYVELHGPSAHVRYLVRRLRQIAPHASVVVGLWTERDLEALDEHARVAMGADEYVGTLEDAVASVSRLASHAPLASAAHGS